LINNTLRIFFKNLNKKYCKSKNSIYICTPKREKVLRLYKRNAEYKYGKNFSEKIWKIGIKVFIFAAAFRGVRKSIKIYWNKGIKKQFFCLEKRNILYLCNPKKKR